LDSIFPIFWMTLARTSESFFQNFVNSSAFW